MPNSKLIGGILLIVGTSIGGGMLALPVSTAPAGMLNSIVFLVFCCFFFLFLMYSDTPSSTWWALLRRDPRARP